MAYSHLILLTLLGVTFSLLRYLKDTVCQGNKHTEGFKENMQPEHLKKH